MTRRLATCLAAFLLALAAVPVFAGTVYVPLTANAAVDGITYTMEILVSNQGNEDRRFTTYFIPEASDGTNRPDGAGQEVLVPGGQTIVLTDVAPLDEIGLLEISGAPQISVTARLVPRVNATRKVGGIIPVISSDNVIAADETVQIQGLDRVPSRFSNFGLVNLGHDTASCQVNLFGPGGGSVIPTALLSLRPLTQLNFPDVLGIVGIDQAGSVRAEVTCDQPYYAYNASVGASGEELAINGPSKSLSSTFITPGEGPPPAACDPGNLCFEVPGLVHAPTAGNRVGRIEMPIPAGTYKRLRAQIDVFISDWSATRPAGTHNIFWLALDKNKNLYGYVNVKGPQANNHIFIRHGIGQPQGQKPRIDSNVFLPTGGTYHFDYIYDTQQRVIELTVTNQNGQVLRVMNGSPDVNNINVGSGSKFLMDLGFSGANPNEPPTFGWRYENMLVEVTPK